MGEIIDIYKDLLEEPDIAHSICKYVANSRCGLEYDFGSTIIRKGTRLFRIRSYESGTDFSDPKQWTPPPNQRQNRCNAAGEVALYLGSTEAICLMETHISAGEKYVLGEYVVTEDIIVGGFNYVKSSETDCKMIVGMAFNAFLIAPVRNKENEGFFEIIDQEFSDTDFSSIDLKAIYGERNIELPYRFGKIIQSDTYYGFTNMLTEVIKKRYPQGIRYSSCYLPLETVGIRCSDYNIVLYETGIRRIQFESYTEKISDFRYTPEFSAKTILKGH